jgi:hypothetical protein
MRLRANCCGFQASIRPGAEDGSGPGFRGIVLVKRTAVLCTELRGRPLLSPSPDRQPLRESPRLLDKDGDQGRDPNEQRRRGEAHREAPPVPLAAGLGARGPTRSRWVERHWPGRKASFRKLSKSSRWCIALPIFRRQERSSPEQISPEQIGTPSPSRGTSRAIRARPAPLSALEAMPADTPAETTTVYAKSPQHPTATMK